VERLHHALIDVELDTCSGSGRGFGEPPRVVVQHLFGTHHNQQWWQPGNVAMNPGLRRADRIGSGQIVPLQRIVRWLFARAYAQTPCVLPTIHAFRLNNTIPIEVPVIKILRAKPLIKPTVGVNPQDADAQAVDSLLSQTRGHLAHQGTTDTPTLLRWKDVKMGEFTSIRAITGTDSTNRVAHDGAVAFGNEQYLTQVRPLHQTESPVLGTSGFICKGQYLAGIRTVCQCLCVEGSSLIFGKPRQADVWYKTNKGVPRSRYDNATQRPCIIRNDFPHNDVHLTQSQYSYAFLSMPRSASHSWKRKCHVPKGMPLRGRMPPP
jgi:hypothetical protein